MADHTGNSIKKILESDAQIIDMAISLDLRYVILEEAERIGNDLKDGGLYIYDLEQRKKRLIDERGVFPSWSPDGDKFIYSKLTEDFKELLILADPELKKKEVLLENTKYYTPLGLSWSTDSTELWSKVERVIAAGIYDPELAKNSIALINPDNGEVRKLTTIENDFYKTLSLSPDGNYLVFSAFNLPESTFEEPWPKVKINIEVYVYDIKNDQIRNISNSPLTDYEAQWLH